jgi:hypothetical protein
MRSSVGLDPWAATGKAKPMEMAKQDTVGLATQTRAHSTKGLSQKLKGARDMCMGMSFKNG